MPIDSTVSESIQTGNSGESTQVGSTDIPVQAELPEVQAAPQPQQPPQEVPTVSAEALEQEAASPTTSGEPVTQPKETSPNNEHWEKIYNYVKSSNGVTTKLSYDDFVGKYSSDGIAMSKLYKTLDGNRMKSPLPFTLGSWDEFKGNSKITAPPQAEQQQPITPEEIPTEAVDEAAATTQPAPTVDIPNIFEKGKDVMSKGFYMPEEEKWANTSGEPIPSLSAPAFSTTGVALDNIRKHNDGEEVNAASLDASIKSMSLPNQGVKSVRNPLYKENRGQDLSGVSAYTDYVGSQNQSDLSNTIESVHVGKYDAQERAKAEKNKVYDPATIFGVTPEIQNETSEREDFTLRTIQNVKEHIARLEDRIENPDNTIQLDNKGEYIIKRKYYANELRLAYKQLNELEKDVDVDLDAEVTEEQSLSNIKEIGKINTEISSLETLIDGDRNILSEGLNEGEHYNMYLGGSDKVMRITSEQIKDPHYVQLIEKNIADMQKAIDDKTVDKSGLDVKSSHKYYNRAVSEFPELSDYESQYYNSMLAVGNEYSVTTKESLAKIRDRYLIEDKIPEDYVTAVENMARTKYSEKVRRDKLAEDPDYIGTYDGYYEFVEKRQEDIQVDMKSYTEGLNRSISGEVERKSKIYDEGVKERAKVDYEAAAKEIETQFSSLYEKTIDSTPAAKELFTKYQGLANEAETEEEVAALNKEFQLELGNIPEIKELSTQRQSAMDVIDKRLTQKYEKEAANFNRTATTEAIDDYYNGLRNYVDKNLVPSINKGKGLLEYIGSEVDGGEFASMPQTDKKKALKNHWNKYRWSLQNELLSSTKKIPASPEEAKKPRSEWTGKAAKTPRELSEDKSLFKMRTGEDAQREFLYHSMNKVMYTGKGKPTAFAIKSWAEQNVEEIKEEKKRIAQEQGKMPKEQFDVSINPLDAPVYNTPKFQKALDPMSDENVVGRESQRFLLLNDAQSRLEAIIRHPESDEGYFSDFYSGLTSGDWSEYVPFVSGGMELMYNYNVYGASQKMQDGKPLNFIEQNMIEAYAGEQRIREAAPTSTSYNVGNGIKDMLPYIGEFVLTMGAFNIGSGLTRKGLEASVRNKINKTVGKGIKEKVAKGVGLEATGKMMIDAEVAAAITESLETGIGKHLVNQFTMAVGAITQSAANPQHLANNVVSRMTPEVQLFLAGGGEDVYTQVTAKGEDFGEAFAKGYGMTWAEFYTEQLGGHLLALPSGAASRLVKNSDWAKRTILGGWYASKKFVNKSDAISHIAKNNIGWHGIIGEYAEEFANGRITSLITGDRGVWDLDAQEEKEMFLTVGVFGLGMGSVNIGKRAIVGSDGKTSLMVDVKDMNGKVQKVGLDVSKSQWSKFKKVLKTNKLSSLNDFFDYNSLNEKQKDVLTAIYSQYNGTNIKDIKGYSEKKAEFEKETGEEFNDEHIGSITDEQLEIEFPETTEAAAPETEAAKVEEEVISNAVEAEPVVEAETITEEEIPTVEVEPSTGTAVETKEETEAPTTEKTETEGKEEPVRYDTSLEDDSISAIESDSTKTKKNRTAAEKKSDDTKRTARSRALKATASSMNHEQVNNVRKELGLKPVETLSKGGVGQLLNATFSAAVKRGKSTVQDFLTAVDVGKSITESPAVKKKRKKAEDKALKTYDSDVAAADALVKKGKLNEAAIAYQAIADKVPSKAAELKEKIKKAQSSDLTDKVLDMTEGGKKATAKSKEEAIAKEEAPEKITELEDEKAEQDGVIEDAQNEIDSMKQDYEAEKAKIKGQKMSREDRSNANADAKQDYDEGVESYKFEIKEAKAEKRKIDRKIKKLQTAEPSKPKAKSEKKAEPKEDKVKKTHVSLAEETAAEKAAKKEEAKEKPTKSKPVSKKGSPAKRANDVMDNVPDEIPIGWDITKELSVDGKPLGVYIIDSHNDGTMSEEEKILAVERLGNIYSRNRSVNNTPAPKLTSRSSGKVKRDASNEVENNTFFNYVMKRLAKAFPKIDVVLKTSYEDFVVAANERGIPLDDISKTKSFFDKDNSTIYFNPKRLNAKSAIHEYAHLWVQVGKLFKTEVIGKGLNLVKDTKYYQDVLNDPNYADLVAKKEFDDIAEEALVRLIADKGIYQVEKGQKATGKLRDWTRRLFNEIGRKLGINPRVRFESMDVHEFSNKVAKELLGQMPLRFSAEVEKSNKTPKSFISRLPKVKREKGTDITSERIAKMSKGQGGLVDIDYGILSPDTWWDKTNSQIKYWFKEDKGVGEFNAKMALVKGDIDKWTKGANFLVKKFYAGLNEHLNIEANKDKNFDKDKAAEYILRDADRVLKAEASPNTLPTLVRGHIVNMRNSLNDLQTRMYNLLDKNKAMTPEFKMSFNQNMGVWVHRSYMMHDIDNYAENWQKFFTEKEKKDIVSRIQNTYGNGNVSKVSWSTTADGRKAFVFHNTAGVESEVMFEDDIDMTDWLQRNVKGTNEWSQIDDAMKGNSLEEGGWNEVWSKRGYEHSSEEGSLVLSKPTESTDKYVTDKFKIVPQDIKTIINEILGKEKGGIGKFGEIKTGAETLGRQAKAIMKGRKTDSELDPLIRKLMGEYLDPATNFTKSTIKLANLYEKSKVEYELASAGEGFYFTNSERKGKRSGWIQVTPKDSYALSQKPTWIHPDLYDVLYGTKEGVLKKIVDFGSTNKALIAYNGMAKAALTIMSPASQARNFWGAWLNLLATGHIVRPVGGKTLTDAIMTATADFENQHEVVGKLMSSPLFVSMQAGQIWNRRRAVKGRGDKTKHEAKIANKEAFVDDFLEAVKYNLIEQSVQAGVVTAVAEKVYNSAVESATVDNVNKMFRAGFEKAVDSFSKPYQATDAIFKIIQWHYETDAFDKAYRNSQGENTEVKFEETSENYQHFIKQKAADMTRREQPTYSKSPAFINSLSKNVAFGAFVQFQYQMWQTRGAIIGSAYNLTKDSIAAEDPVMKKQLRKMALKKASGLLGSLALSPTLHIASMILNGIDGDDDKRIDAMMPKYARNALRVYIGESVIEPTFIDLQYVDPSSTFHKPLLALIRGDLGGAAGEILTPFIGGEIGTSKLFESFVNTDGYGGKIYLDSDDRTTKIVKGISHGLSAIIPAFVGQGANIAKGWNEETSEWGHKYHFWQELINTTAGGRIKSKDLNKAYQSRINASMKAIDELKRDYKEKIGKGEDPNSYHLLPLGETEFEYTNRRIEEEYNGMRTAYSSYGGLLHSEEKKGKVGIEALSTLRKNSKNWLPRHGSEGKKGGTLLSNWMVTALEDGVFNGVDKETGDFVDKSDAKTSGQEQGRGGGGQNQSR